MGNLYDLLFEVSNEDRRRILLQLDKRAMNVTNLSKELGLTKQEVSRHISRLGEVGLTQKDVRGSYHLALYGKLVLKQLEGLDFISRHRNYFASHSLVHLPHEFVYRVGELAGSTYVSEVSAAFFNVDRVIQEAEEYIWSITDQHLVSTYPLLMEAVERGVKVREVEAKDWVVSAKIMQQWYAEDAVRKATLRARGTGLLEERILERLDVYLYMSEKEAAAAAFPLPNGRFDHLGFSAVDERACEWCKDLFQYYWERAPKRDRVVGELYSWIKQRPKAIHALKNIVAREEIVDGEELISELEKAGLIKQGNLTVLGQFVYARLQR